MRAKMRMATGMVASLKKLSGKAKAKIIEDTMVPKIIEATGEVTIEKKDDYLKLGSYLRDCKLSNFPQKLQRIEDHVNYFYEKNETVVPLDILDNVASTPSLLNIIKIKLNPKWLRNKVSSSTQEQIIKQSIRLKKTRYKFNCQPINEPKLQGRLNIKEQSNVNLATSYFTGGAGQVKSKRQAASQQGMPDAS